MIHHRVPPPSNANISNEPEVRAYAKAMAEYVPKWQESVIESAHAKYLKEKQLKKPEAGYWGKLGRIK